jgi:hypothetical protein
MALHLDIGVDLAEGAIQGLDQRFQFTRDLRQ